MCKTTEIQNQYEDDRLVNLWLPQETFDGMKKATDFMGISNRELIIRIVDYMDDILKCDPKFAT